MDSDRVTMIISIISVLFLVIYYYVQYSKWSNQQNNLIWPISINQCPDYWTSNGEGICVNKHSLGNCPIGSNKKVLQNGEIDFKTIVGNVTANPSDEELFNQEMNSKQNLIKKCKWAKQCGSSWEGVDHLCA